MIVEEDTIVGLRWLFYYPENDEERKVLKSLPLREVSAKGTGQCYTDMGGEPERTIIHNEIQKFDPTYRKAKKGKAEYTLTEAAKELGVTKETMKAYAHTYSIGHKREGRWYFYDTEIEERKKHRKKKTERRGRPRRKST